MKRFLYILVLLFFCTTPVFAIEEKNTDVKVLSIDDCVKLALENSPNIKTYKEKAKIAKDNVTLAWSDYFPTLTASTSYNLSHNHVSYSDNDIESTSSTTNTFQAQAGVNQLIWDFGKTVANINMAKYNEKASEYELDNRILETTYNTKVAYYTVLAAIANLQLAEKTYIINELNYERTKALFEEGLKSKIDVVNSEVYTTEAEIRIVEAVTTYKNAIIKLNNAMYLNEPMEYVLKNTENFKFNPNDDLKNLKQVKNQIKDNKNNEASAILISQIKKDEYLLNYEFTADKKTLEQVIDYSKTHRPDLNALELVEKAADESLKAVIRSYLPKINLSLGYSYRKNSTNSTNALTGNISADLGLNALAIKSKVSQAKSNLNIAGFNKELADKNAYYEVQNCYTNAKQYEKTIPLLKDKIRQTRENFELADGRYIEGLNNFIELQDAQVNYNKAQLTYIQEVFNYKVAKAKLEKAMGVK